MYQFRVAGIAQPAGSKKSFVPRRSDGSVIYRANGSIMTNVIDDNPKSPQWKRHVAREAKKHCPVPLKGPILLVVTFVMPRPKSHFRTGKFAHVLREDAPFWHTVRPDATKLVRGLEDALTGIAWFDDAQVASQRPDKVYCAPGIRPYVSIAIHKL